MIGFAVLVVKHFTGAIPSQDYKSLSWRFSGLLAPLSRAEQIRSDALQHMRETLKAVSCIGMFYTFAKSLQGGGQLQSLVEWVSESVPV